MKRKFVKRTKQELIDALQQAESSFGPDHLNTADAMKDLVMALSSEYQDQTAHPDMEPLCRRRVEIIENHFGDESIEFSDATFLHAQILEHSGRIEDAVPMLFRSWQLSKKLLGNDHDRTWPKHLTFVCYIDEMEKNGQKYSFDLTKNSKKKPQKRGSKQEISYDQQI